MGLLISDGGAETKSKNWFWLLDQPSHRAAKANFASALFSPAHSCSETCFSSGARDVWSPFAVADAAILKDT